MIRPARRRPGTSPSFWRAFHRAQSRIVASSTRLRMPGMEKDQTIQELIAEYEKTKRPAAAHFVYLGW